MFLRRIKIHKDGKRHEYWALVESVRTERGPRHHVVAFEGEEAKNPQAQRGYSRDKRSDCKQVCIALVVTTEGIPFGYEVFEGNRHDSKTLKEIVAKMELLYGKSDRVWTGGPRHGQQKQSETALLGAPPLHHRDAQEHAQEVRGRASQS